MVTVRGCLVANDEGKRTSIGISQRTKDNLNSIKHTGQSYNGLIQELVKFWKDKRGENWTRRQIRERKITEESVLSRSDTAGVRS